MVQKEISRDSSAIVQVMLSGTSRGFSTPATPADKTKDSTNICCLFLLQSHLHSLQKEPLNAFSLKKLFLLQFIVTKVISLCQDELRAKQKKIKANII